MADTESTEAAKGRGLEALLLGYADQTFRDFSRFRWAEEREWYEAALFYQRRQWLSWNEQSRRWQVVKQDAKHPRPMPVSNYFALTINANANQLAAQLPRMQATARSDDDGDRRAADMAEKAIPAIDKESGMRVLNPILAKHTVLWGLGVTKDSFDASLSTGITRVPETSIRKTKVIHCLDCAGSYDVAPDQVKPQAPAAAGEAAAAQVDAQGNPVDNAGGAAAGDNGEPVCPQCGSRTVTTSTRSETVTDNVRKYGRGRMVTEVRPIFEIYLPRDSQDPNLAKRVCQRYRRSLGELKRVYGEEADDLQADASTEVQEIYLEALRSIVAYNWMNERTSQACTVTEVWCDWDELSDEIQEAIQQECDPEEAEQWEELGGFIVCAGGKLLDYGPNPFEGKKPYTFYQWEKDPANVYPKGLAIDLIPLQKRLNRLDSLIELAMMCNAAGKWLWPLTQSAKAPTGSPNEVVQYEVIGDGKVAPTFVQPSPLHESAWGFRQTILGDFQQLGMTQGASRGEAPGNVSSFRGLAYLGAKADEQTSTQRFLYELGHQLRYEKCLVMARKFWDEPRLAKVAGPNGKFLVREFVGEELEGNYDLELIPDSSKPHTLAEKQQAFGALLQAGMVDIHDPATRDFILDMANLPQLDLALSLQYLKAERDLEKAKQGFAAPAVPACDPVVFAKVFSDFTLTEEFEDLEPAAQQSVLAAAADWEQKAAQAAAAGAPPPKETASLTAAFKDIAAFRPAAADLILQKLFGVPPQAPAPGAVDPRARALGDALLGAANKNPLQGVPGVGPSAQQVEHAAIEQGNEVAAGMGA